MTRDRNETVTNCNALKLRAADGKMRLTDVADTEQLSVSFSPDRAGNAVQKVAQWAKDNGRKFALVEYQDLTPASARMVPRALQRCSVAVQNTQGAGL